VIDRKMDYDLNHFDSWLVHSEHALIHLSLNEDKINEAINTCLPVISPTKGEVYISECSINSPSNPSTFLQEIKPLESITPLNSYGNLIVTTDLEAIITAKGT
jgi:hypothetical protein